MNSDRLSRLPEAWWQIYVGCLPDEEPSIRTERVFIELPEGPVEFVRADIAGALDEKFAGGAPVSGSANFSQTPGVVDDEDKDA